MAMSLDLTFRPIRLEDKPRILAFTTYTWGEENEDYIPSVFDDWLNDPQGEFTAAVLNDEVVGISKLSDLGGGEWWLEGLRVDPAHRRKGIAQAFNRHHVDRVRQLGGGVIRYMTGGENIGSQTIGTRAGFQHILTFAAYLADATHELDVPATLTLNDVPALMAWLDSPLVRYQHSAYRNSWTVRTLNEQAITQAVERQRVVGLKDRAGRVSAWAMLREDGDDDEDGAHRQRLRVDHLDGEPAAIVELARAMRSFATGQQRSIVSAGISDYPPLVDAITQAGYQLNSDNFRLWVLELRVQPSP
jgi:ribosomal protein S18 acetylase RimI-like enzyme